jgi:hypothetical protein
VVLLEKIENMSGNSAQNRTIKRAVERALEAAGKRLVPENDLPPAAVPIRTPMGRFFQFAEHTMTIAAIGLVGSVAALYIYGPIFAICFLMFVLALHRSKAVTGLRTWIQAVCYAVVVLVSGSVLFGSGLVIEKHKEHP